MRPVVFALIFLTAALALAYESPTLGSFTSTTGTPACVTLPAGLPAISRIVVQCRGAPCHYRAQAAGGNTVNQHDAMLAQDGLFDVPIDSSIGQFCFVGDASATVTGDLFRGLP